MDKFCLSEKRDESFFSNDRYEEDQGFYYEEDVKEFVRRLREYLNAPIVNASEKEEKDIKDYSKAIVRKLDKLAGEKLK